MDLEYIKDELSDEGHQFPFKIKIACTGETRLPIEEFTEFQGNLKSRDEDDIIKILRSIRDYGFSFPFFLWKSGRYNYILDGHGRLYALKIFKALGGVIPPLPISRIKAANRNEAKQKLLRLNSRYGDIDLEGLKDFVEGLDISVDDLKLPEIDFNMNYILSSNRGNYDKAEKPRAVKIATDDIPRTTEGLIERYDNFYISYSGGRDSTLAMYETVPALKAAGKNVSAVFVDTGYEFPDLLPYIFRTTSSLGVPLKILHPRRDFYSIYVKKRAWPDSIFRDCIATLIADPIDNYCSEAGEEYILIRGGRSKQKTTKSKSDIIQRVKEDPLKIIFNPLHYMDQETYDARIDDIPLWPGYEKGFCRTACWCCPFQNRRQWDALKEYYPLLWDEMRALVKTLRYKRHEGDGYIARIKEYWGELH